MTQSQKAFDSWLKEYSVAIQVCLEHSDEKLLILIAQSAFLRGEKTNLVEMKEEFLARSQGAHS